MKGSRITNCHIHTFTHLHVPVFYPHVLIWPFKALPGLIRLFALLLGIFSERLADRLHRLARFQREGAVWSQDDLLDRVRMHYPANTRFVVLPMDLEPTGFGRVRRPLAAQHDELAGMAERAGADETVLPFATIHPGRGQAGVDELLRCLDRRRADGAPLFRGLKIYPRLGFPPDHELLMRQVYPELQARDLPVMTHCSRGGVQGRGVTDAAADRYTDPRAYVPVMTAFPRLRVCLAHFGGARDWRDYIEHGIDPADPEARADNWQVAIRDMIGSGRYPGLWTDISYTLFHFEDNLPFLQLFLEGDPGVDRKLNRLRRRVLFGSDFYMTRQERLSERAVCFRLRNALGEEMFWQIAETNPAVWLGEASELGYPGN